MYTHARTTTGGRLPLPEVLQPVTVRPGDDGFALLRHTYIWQGSPAAVVRARGPEDIAAAVAHARSMSLPLAVRSGGHGVSGRSTNDGGLVVDLGRLNRVEVLDAATRRVRVESGARWADVAAALTPHGMAVSSGDSGDVGVGGLATAGGIGLLGRRHGLTIDHVRAVEVVLADGTFVRADEDHHADLFWAMRGAGANFGVATAFEFEAAPVGEVVGAMTIFGVDDAGGFLTRWGAAVEAAPREVSSFLTVVLDPQGSGRLVAQGISVYAGSDLRAGQAALAPILASAPVLGGSVSLVPYHAMLPATREPHSAQQPLSIVRSGLLDHVNEAVASGIGAAITGGHMALAQLRSVGGAVNDVAQSATAYAHRSQNFALMAATVPPLEQEFVDHWSRIRPYVNGIYSAFESGKGEELLREAFPEPTLDRLRKVKGQYDPHEVFNQNFPIPSARPGGDRRSPRSPG